MDEIWQRYRTFFTPVLIGLGVFLVALIVVHMMSPDPDEARYGVDRAARDLKNQVRPSTDKISTLKANQALLAKRAEDLAKMLDASGLAADPMEAAVSQALQAAVLRGNTPEALRRAFGRFQEELVRPRQGVEPGTPEAADKAIAAVAPEDRGPVEAFERDPVAAEQALRQYDRAVKDRVALLRTGNANVAFSRLLNDVASELKVRANRADVELEPELLGFGIVQSVTRAQLPRRLWNLALVARVVDAAIRSGAVSVDDVRFIERANPTGPEAFLLEWPVTFRITGKMRSLKPVLDLLTDPKRPTPLREPTQLTQPPRGSPEEGVVELTITASSVQVVPGAPLNLEEEGT
jgi:hypothetical protein